MRRRFAGAFCSHEAFRDSAKGVTHNEDKNRMSHTPHELADDFPDKVDAIHRLKTSNAHFAKLADEYHSINRAVHRAETEVEPMESGSETDLRKRRMILKDEIAKMLG